MKRVFLLSSLVFFSSCVFEPTKEKSVSRISQSSPLVSLKRDYYKTLNTDCLITVEDIYRFIGKDLTGIPTRCRRLKVFEGGFYSGSLTEKTEICFKGITFKGISKEKLSRELLKKVEEVLRRNYCL